MKVVHPYPLSICTEGFDRRSNSTQDFPSVAQDKRALPLEPEGVIEIVIKTRAVCLLIQQLCNRKLLGQKVVKGHITDSTGRTRLLMVSNLRFNQIKPRLGHIDIITKPLEGTAEVVGQTRDMDRCRHSCWIVGRVVVVDIRESRPKELFRRTKKNTVGIQIDTGSKTSGLHPCAKQKHSRKAESLDICAVGRMVDKRLLERIKFGSSQSLRIHMQIHIRSSIAVVSDQHDLGRDAAKTCDGCVEVVRVPDVHQDNRKRRRWPTPNREHVYLQTPTSQ